MWLNPWSVYLLQELLRFLETVNTVTVNLDLFHTDKVAPSSCCLVQSPNAVFVNFPDDCLSALQAQ